MTTPFDHNSYLFNGNATFLEELYEQYFKDPMSVAPEWREFFTSFSEDAKSALGAAEGASWAPHKTAVIGQSEKEEKPAGKEGKPQLVIGKEVVEATSQDSIRAVQLIRAYRVRGNLVANYDPLGLEVPAPHPELDPATYGFKEKDYDRPIFIGGSLGLQTATLREILTILKQTYCGTFGVEFMHIMDPDQKAWIQKHVEGARGKPNLSAEEKKRILDRLIEIEAFESFLQLKYPGTKRFSVQGGDAMLPGLDAVIETSANLGVEEINIGMPHRGRMNVITATMGKPYAELLSIFHGNLDFPEWVDSSGDVKYHLGVSSDRVINGKKIHLSLASNPSHLEAVNPVVCGKVRAKQDQRGDTEKSKVMGLTLHGDAAFAGQGSVPETLALADLRGYRTGGTLHIIVNNQIGFTTSPKYSRFTPFPSDVAKAVQAPIFHVNGDDPEAVIFACRLASEFRQQFKRDTVVDIVCYRRYGHNESDEPMFTQPIMYRKISQQKVPSLIYADRLIAEGTITKTEVDAKFAEWRARFDKDYDAAKEFKPNKANWLEGYWAGFEKPKGEHPNGDTGMDVAKLREIGNALATPPENFAVNPKILRQLEAKKKMMESGEGLDWAMGEALAFGSLLKEGFPVRLSGQDCCRGTFSHRHSVLIDQENENRYVPLNHLGGEQKHFEVIDSSLSEYAILGFEYGYSLAEPRGLTLWEAQFGDFANGAQVIIDQFIASGEIKWLRMSGLVMLLPHGYEGQGPEHSSARLERFLQLCGEDNMQVANCTTPANLFHILRRQLHRKFRKPLILMTPKSLLRHKLAISKLADFGKGTHFQRVLPEIEKLADDKKIKRLVLCSGKVYYDLFEERARQKIDDIALVRVEQLYPFPAKELADVITRYSKAEIFWCQEEPKNMGAWTFMAPTLADLCGRLGRAPARIQYVGRKEAASPAAGYLKIHEREQKALIAEALDVKLEAAAVKKAG